MSNHLTLTAINNFPLVEAGDDLATLISQGLRKDGHALRTGDILVIVQKVVSKAEGRIVNLKDVTPTARALALAEETQKDARLVELILSESKSQVRLKKGVLIVEHRNGWIMANAGIDASNVASEGDEENVLLLPVDPDKSADIIRQKLQDQYGCDVAVVISDSFGRPWRLGTTGVAIGAAGLPSLWDRRGDTDLFGRELKVTQLAVADEVSTAASLLHGQTDEGRPVVLLRGLDFSNFPSARARPASDLIRDISEDMFR